MKSRNIIFALIYLPYRRKAVIQLSDNSTALPARKGTF
jgi:hypothetical protein